MADTLTKAKKPAVEPTTGWRNWWRANVTQFSQVLDVNGRETGDEQIREAGEQWCSVAIFASKSQAEERALEILHHAADESTVFNCEPILTYLGAYPDGAGPKQADAP